MSEKQSQKYWKMQLKYAVISTIIIFFIGGITAILLDTFFPPYMTLKGFITVGLFTLGVYWIGIIACRFLIKWGIYKKTD